MCQFSGGESADLWVRTHRKARKEHRCESCGGIIKPGRTYLSLFTIFDGNADRTKCCLPCERLADKFGREHGNHTPHPTGLADTLVECIDEGDDDAWKWKLALHKLNARRAA